MELFLCRNGRVLGRDRVGSLGQRRGHRPRLSEGGARGRGRGVETREGKACQGGQHRYCQHSLGGGTAAAVRPSNHLVGVDDDLRHSGRCQAQCKRAGQGDRVERERARKASAAVAHVCEVAVFHRLSPDTGSSQSRDTVASILVFALAGLVFVDEQIFRAILTFV